MPSRRTPAPTLQATRKGAIAYRATPAPAAAMSGTNVSRLVMAYTQVTAVALRKIQIEITDKQQNADVRPLSHFIRHLPRHADGRRWPSTTAGSNYIYPNIVALACVPCPVHVSLCKPIVRVPSDEIMDDGTNENADDQHGEHVQAAHETPQVAAHYGSAIEIAVQPTAASQGIVAALCQARVVHAYRARCIVPVAAGFETDKTLGHYAGGTRQ